jgi:response regulator RpfG family c-di-GMP phosphodiesterase
MNEPFAASAAPRADAPPPASRPRVLCVDDEPNVLDGLTLHLRRVYDVVTAAGGAAALDLIRAQGAPAVVVSDMRMPGMDGNALLGAVRRIAPDTVRLLLTGRADLDSAIAAINDGQVFRFLTKPCAPPELLAAVGAAADQHRLITAERVLLEQTLHGSIAALVDVLSLTSPVSFGRATRIRQLAGDLADRLGMPDRWQIEVAAMLSQLGCVTLPRDVAEKVYHGRFLTPDEQAMVAGLPAVTERLLAHIPRLEDVRAILTQHQRPLRRRNRVRPGQSGAVRCATGRRRAAGRSGLRRARSTRQRACGGHRHHARPRRLL